MLTLLSYKRYLSYFDTAKVEINLLLTVAYGSFYFIIPFFYLFSWGYDGGSFFEIAHFYYICLS